MNLPNAGHLIVYPAKGQAVNNFFEVAGIMAF